MTHFLSKDLPERLGTLKNRIHCPAVERFSVAETFGLEEGHPDAAFNTAVRFKEHFGDLVEHNVPAQGIRLHSLMRDSLDLPILLELGEESCQVHLAHIWFLVTRRSSRLIKGYPSFGFSQRDHFYARDTKGVLWSLNVHHTGEKWGIGNRSIESNHPHNAGSQFFSL